MYSHPVLLCYSRYNKMVNIFNVLYIYICMYVYINVLMYIKLSSVSFLNKPSGFPTVEYETVQTIFTLFA